MADVDTADRPLNRMGQSSLPTPSSAPTSRDSHPLVSIGVLVYNEERHLRSMLDSLLAQDYENFEVIISDDASTDETALICQDYSGRDRRIHYYENETNLGSIPNFNRVVNLASGEFFMWACGHDLYDPAFISSCLNAIVQDSAIVLSYAQTWRIDPLGQPLELVLHSLDTRGMESPSSRLKKVLWLYGAFALFGLFRTSALRRVPMQRVAAPDIVLLAELSLLGTFAHIPEPLFYARNAVDYGDWRVHLEKHFKHRGTGWSAQMLFWRMLVALIRGVTRRVDRFPEKIAGVWWVLVCVILRYRWVLLGLLSVAVGRRSPAQKPTP